LRLSELPRELGDFVLEKIIGQGGMGEVYLGRQISLDRPVAIKLLRDEYARDESFIARFKREAKSAAKLIHPNIIQVYQLGDSNGEYYFAMEFVEGKDLQVILKENKGKLSTQESVQIIFGVAKALEIAGQFGIVHRDIKPSNVLITKENNIKVMDFGLAKAFQDSSTNVTMSGAVMGTANYMSPEQAEGKDVDQRTDIYSLGVMFYQLLTGYLPFSGENPTSLAFQHVHSKPIAPMDKINGVSKGLNDICVKCLAKKKEDRYQNATELMADLQLAVDGSNTNYGFGSAKSMIGKTMMDSSSDATIVSSVGANDRTFVPSMSAPTKVDGTSLTQADPRSISNTVVMGFEKTEIKLQDVRADSGRINPADEKKKSNALLPIAIAGIVLLGLGIWFVTKNNDQEPAKPKTLKDAPVVNNNENQENVTQPINVNGLVSTETKKEVVTELPKEASIEKPKEDPKVVVTEPSKEVAKEIIKETPKEVPKEAVKEPVKELVKEIPKEAPKESPKETNKFLPPDSKEVVEISLDELKTKLPKGFKIRVGILDDQNQRLNLDDVKSINRLPGNQRIELTHDYYDKVVADIKIDESGKISLESLPLPNVNHEKIAQQIDNYLITSRKEELKKMLRYGFTDKDLALLKDRIRILELEDIASDIYKKGGAQNIVKSYNLLSTETILSPDGLKLKAKIKEDADKDSKIRQAGAFLEELKETLITNKSGMTFEIIEAGEFFMGSNSDPLYPKRKVKITKKFAIGNHEVTNKEFREIFPDHISSSYLNLDMNGDAQPVVFVDWLKAKKYCELLSKKEGKVYRLPTEAEWEYCARGGVATDYSWGNKPEDFKKNANILDKSAPDAMAANNSPFGIEDGFVVSAPIGSFAPNRFKLFDMDGNVREWVNDYFVDGASLKDGEADPKGPVSGDKKCVRGASFSSGMKTGALTFRQGKYDDIKLNDIGFRVVLELEEKKE
jgi:serine/threonine protein kinase/formylglycine-generating enzyme required for sulfatase activity